MENTYVKKEFTAEEFARDMELELVLDGGKPVSVASPNVNRMWLQLTGHFEYFTEDRVQIIGPSEVHFLDSRSAEERAALIDRLFENPFTCVVFSRGLKADDRFIGRAKTNGVSVFRSKLPTSELISHVVEKLKDLLAQTVQEHGVLMDINGVGVMICGNSGIGKSEIALELLRRGHRIVADDVVVIKRIGDTVEGSANPLVRNFMELRGVGLVNIVNLCGVESIKLTQQVELIIQLEEWDENKNYERLGGESESREILGVKITQMTIPVSPGRNIAVVVETAASVYRLQKMGYNAMDELSGRMKNSK